MPKRILVNLLKKERKREKGENEKRLEREAPKYMLLTLKTPQKPPKERP
jgi:hypothetical protein